MQMLTVPGPTALLYVLIGVTILLVATIAFRPSLTATRGGKQFAFVVYLLLPVVVASMGASEHMERSPSRKALCIVPIPPSWRPSSPISSRV
jgi:hypothetical protein